MGSGGRGGCGGLAPSPPAAPPAPGPSGIQQKCSRASLAGAPRPRHVGAWHRDRLPRGPGPPVRPVLWVPPERRSPLTGAGSGRASDRHVGGRAGGGTVRPASWEVVLAALTPPPGSPVTKGKTGLVGGQLAACAAPRPPGLHEGTCHGGAIAKVEWSPAVRTRAAAGRREVPQRSRFLAFPERGRATGRRALSPEGPPCVTPEGALGLDRPGRLTGPLLPCWDISDNDLELRTRSHVTAPDLQPAKTCGRWPRAPQHHPAGFGSPPAPVPEPGLQCPLLCPRGPG